MRTKNITGDLDRDVSVLREMLPAQDILSFPFVSGEGLRFFVFFTDPVTDKELLGDQVVRPLRRYRGDKSARSVREALTAPEHRAESSFKKLSEEALAGNPVLLWEGMDEAIVVGTKKVFVRAIAEPSTDVAVKGPREGFIEDVKINTSLVRRRLKTPALRIEMLEIGRVSHTFVALCWLENITPEQTVEKVRAQLKKIDIDILPDSSYLTHFLSRRPHSLLKQVGTTEKPDIFCAKIAEGRVGLLTDGSPVALTLPYMLVEDFQSAEDYFVPAHRATFTRILRFTALFVAVYLPAFYIAAQLFKLQLFR